MEPVQSTAMETNGSLFGAVYIRKNLAKGTARALEVVGRLHLHLHNHQHVFGLILNRKTHQLIMGRLQRTWRCGLSRWIITCSC